MGISHEDITELKRVFDDRYVLQSSCNEIQEQTSKKFSNDDKRIELILAEQKNMREEQRRGFALNNTLTSAVLAAIVGAIIAFYFFR